MAKDPEFVVVGAGAAGIAAALALSRRGAGVVLLERRGDLGGTVTHALIHTIAGLYDSEAQPINAGLPVELIQRLSAADPYTKQRKIGRTWVLDATPSVYDRIVSNWLQEEAAITVLRNCGTVDVEVEGEMVRRISFTRDNQRRTLEPSALFDCTGDANVVASIDRRLIEEDDGQALAGLILRLGDVRTDDLIFPRNLAVQRSLGAAVEQGALPRECANAWFDSGVEPNEMYLKLSLSAADGQEPNTAAETIAATLLAHLADLPAFAKARLLGMGEVTRRSGNRIRGDYRLTVDDVRQLRRFPDTACRCAWPIEYWSAGKGVTLEYLSGNGMYEIPLRALRVARFRNLWAAGKCLSSDHLAQASARVSGCCWAMGQAAANAAVEVSL